MTYACPNCGNEQFATVANNQTVRRETALRTRFVLDRVEKTPPPEERKDLTDFAHGKPASILECRHCSVLLRAEEQTDPVETYVDDPYDTRVMEHLFPRYVEAFRAKEQPYRSLIRAGAEILEIGPHFGAFLEVATEWQWKPLGVDVGKDTTDFVNSKGFVVYNHPLEECKFPDAWFDGVFVWNCFEQIPDPHATLAEIHRVLKRNGLLVVRTPNALLYRVCEQFLRESPDSILADWIIKALGYNNLLAFPYLYGYSSRTLIELAAPHGFECEGKLDTEIITLPFPELHHWVVEEHRAARAALEQWSELERLKATGDLTGPWIELFYRAV